MKLVFVYWGYEDAGSMGDLRAYARAARALGHEITVYGPIEETAHSDKARYLQGAYGPPKDRAALNYSLNLKGADAVIFIFEWTTRLRDGGRMDWARLVGAVPRRRRVVIDCDGGYNDVICFKDDYNHLDEKAGREWVAVCDSLSDKVCQPTLQPRRPNVRPFFFHVYDPMWETPLDFRAKEFSLIYVGHTKWRWRPMLGVLQTLESVRDQVGRIALVGDGWAGIPDWASEGNVANKYYVDLEYLKRLRIETCPAISYRNVIPTMSRGVVNPVVYRPLFEHLQLVTCRTFETPAASTIPLFLLDQDYVRGIYGDRAKELVLAGERPHEKILDMLARPNHYAEIVDEIRQEFRRRHSPEARLRELIGIVES